VNSEWFFADLFLRRQTYNGVIKFSGGKKVLSPSFWVIDTCAGKLLFLVEHRFDQLPRSLHRCVCKYLPTYNGWSPYFVYCIRGKFLSCYGKFRGNFYPKNVCEKFEFFRGKVLKNQLPRRFRGIICTKNGPQVCKLFIIPSILTFYFRTLFNCIWYQVKAAMYLDVWRVHL
jgi:hypothetical protein